MSSCKCGLRAEAIHKHWKRLAHRSRLLRFMTELRHKCVDRWTMWTRYSDVEKKIAARNWLSSLKSIISPLLKSNNLIIFLLEVIWQLGVARSQFFKFYQSEKKKPHRSNSNVCLTMSNRNFLMNCLINAFLRNKANMILEDQFPYHYPWPHASMCLGRALLVFQRFDFLVFQLNGLVKLLRLWHELI